MTPPADPLTLARVAARLREEIAHLEKVVASLADALVRWGDEDQHVVTIHGVAGLVHDFYTGLEKCFREVSPELNGHTHAPDTWHRDLLHTMTLDLPGFRPPVVRAELEPALAELLRFRHRYRNMYGFNLRWDLVRARAREVLALWPEVRGDVLSFAAELEAIAQAGRG